MSKILVTTALEETWQDNKPILFLGEWCCRYSRKEKWQNINSEVMPYHWDNREKLYRDYKYITVFYEKLLGELTEKLNHIHGVNHSVRYWRILIGPWLSYFLQMLFDRWYTIQYAVTNYDISETIILSFSENDFIPKDMDDFIRLFVGDQWNHYIYSLIIKNNTKLKYTIRSKQSVNEIQPHTSILLVLKKTLSSLSKIVFKFINAFSRNNDVFIIGTSLPLVSQLRLSLRLHQLPQIWQTEKVLKITPDIKRRGWKLVGESDNDYESFVRENISLQIPTIYLEGFETLCERSKLLHWPKNPKLIWTSNNHNSDELFKVWMAGKIERGIPLVIGQHGGAYGISRWMSNENHEIAISDRFITWGWSEKNNSKLLPVGQLKAKKSLNVNHYKQTEILLVTTVVPRYSYWMYSFLVSRQFLDYFKDQCTFVENLPREIRDALVVRLYPNDYGWDQEKRWRDHFPEQKIDLGKTNINDLIRQSRLYISTYNATTFLESFTMNVPTVIYWDPKLFELRVSAVPFFNELKKVGVFHETPESAAKHVAEIWNDVEAWWESNEVSQTVKRFCDRFAHLPDDYLKPVESALIDVINEHESNVLNRSKVH